MTDQDQEQKALAEQLFVKKEYAQSAAILQKLLETNSDDPNLWSLLAYDQYEMGDWYTALESTTQSMNHDFMRKPHVLILYAQIFIKLKRFSEAAYCLEIAQSMPCDPIARQLCNDLRGLSAIPSYEYFEDLELSYSYPIYTILNLMVEKVFFNKDFDSCECNFTSLPEIVNLFEDIHDPMIKEFMSAHEGKKISRLKLSIPILTTCFFLGMSAYSAWTSDPSRMKSVGLLNYYNLTHFTDAEPKIYEALKINEPQKLVQDLEAIIKKTFSIFMEKYDESVRKKEDVFHFALIDAARDFYFTGIAYQCDRMTN